MDRQHCKCNEMKPVQSGNAVVGDSNIPLRPLLAAQGFRVVEAGLTVDEHDCYYVQAINKLIPKAQELAEDEHRRIVAVTPPGSKAPVPSPATLFHKWMDTLAEEKGLRKAVAPELKRDWTMRQRNGKRH